MEVKKRLKKKRKHDKRRLNFCKKKHELQQQTEQLETIVPSTTTTMTTFSRINLPPRIPIIETVDSFEDDDHKEDENKPNGLEEELLRSRQKPGMMFPCESSTSTCMTPNVEAIAVTQCDLERG